MPVYVALLRAINVGGTGKLPMTELRDLCESAGFDCVKTYIQSGNVIFKSALPEAKVKAKLEKALTAKMGKPFFALVRTATELGAVVKRNPFKQATPNQVLVLFLDEKPAKNALAGLKIPGREKVELTGREVFIHYPDGMGRSKLRIPFAKTGTGRNLNTVETLATMAEAPEARMSLRP
jgi:uncharacterized protein (DUF1697 family)